MLQLCYTGRVYPLDFPQFSWTAVVLSGLFSRRCSCEELRSRLPFRIPAIECSIQMEEKLGEEIMAWRVGRGRAPVSRMRRRSRRRRAGRSLLVGDRGRGSGGAGGEV